LTATRRPTDARRDLAVEEEHANEMVNLLDDKK